MPFCPSLSDIFPSGTLLAPGAFFAADADTGFYLAGANTVGIAAAKTLLVAGAGHTGNILDIQDNVGNPLLTFEPNNTTIAGITTRLMTIGYPAARANTIKLTTETGPGHFWTAYADNIFSGHANHFMSIGYNRTGISSQRADLTEHALSFVVEPTYWPNPATEIAECYWEYCSADGLVGRRPFHTTIDTATHAVDNMISGRTNFWRCTDNFVMAQFLETPEFLAYVPTVIRLTDTVALQVQNAGSVPTFVVDTTNGNAYSAGKIGAGGNPNASAAAVVALYLSTGATVYPCGISSIIRKYQAVAGEYIMGGNFAACSYASSGDSNIAVQAGVYAAVEMDASNLRTNTVTYAAAFWAVNPTFAGAGTHVIAAALAGVFISNQGNAKLANSHGLYIASQANSATNYAIRTGTGINYLGDQTRIYQPAAGGAVPPLLLSQADDDQDMIEFTGTVGVGNCIEAIGAKTLTTTHFIKVTITGVGDRYIPVGTIA